MMFLLPSMLINQPADVCKSVRKAHKDYMPTMIVIRVWNFVHKELLETMIPEYV